MVSKVSAVLVLVMVFGVNVGYCQFGLYSSACDQELSINFAGTYMVDESSTERANLCATAKALLDSERCKNQIPDVPGAKKTYMDRCEPEKARKLRGGSGTAVVRATLLTTVATVLLHLASA